MTFFLVWGILALWTTVCHAKDLQGDTKSGASSVIAPPEGIAKVPILTGKDVGKLCEPFEYCQGTRFGATVSVRGKTVTCNQVPRPEHRCCLPSEVHFVCYNIQVDGLFLSFDQSNSAYSTDFTEFCRLMLEAEGHEAGQYSSITKDVNSGQIVFRYDDWANAPATTGAQGDEYHIRDLACGIKAPPKRS